MIIPVRCFTCAKVLADKWVYFQEKKTKRKSQEKPMTPEDVVGKDASHAFFEDIQMGDVLDDLGLTRPCCRSIMISHVDLVEVI